MLNNLFKFCVLGNAILHVDTTFKLVDGLSLTDTTYKNEALIDLKDSTENFPGPASRTSASLEKATVVSQESLLYGNRSFLV